jgi:murein DD-endopeptidase MepM/ murein hydrolase activator NlpD
MGGNVRNLVRTIGSPLIGAIGAVVLAAGLAGCSADISRFSGPSYGLTEARPIPSEPVYDGTAPAYAQGTPAAAPAGAPPPDYSNNNFGDNIHPTPGNPYPVPGYGVASGVAAPASGAATGFGTVPGQPESYHPERLASLGGTAYIVSPARGTGPSGAPAASVPQAAATPIVIAPRRPAPGELIEVMPGETLYMFSRRNGVSISAVMQANNMHSPNVSPGMKLIIPGKGGRSILPPMASVLPVAPVAAAPTAPNARPQTASTAFAAPVAPGAGDNQDGTYTVQAGDSIYSIARKHHLKPQDVMALNGITDVTKVKFGQVLKLPTTSQVLRPMASAQPAKPTPTQFAALQPSANGAASVMSDASQDGIPAADGSTDQTAAQNDMAPVGPPRAAKPAKGTIITAAMTTPKPKGIGPVDPASARILTKASASAAQPADANASPVVGAQNAIDVPSDGRFRWPAEGRIVGKFGAVSGGAQNEGIDMAVPMGTEVHAAENGVVAYVGDELKGFGKLVLIRHADNWVTAYAHNDELLVKRGDQIRRGQVIAKSGKSGGIDQPLLHFELRKGSQPVDPMPHMAAN